MEVLQKFIKFSIDFTFSIKCKRREGNISAISIFIKEGGATCNIFGQGIVKCDLLNSKNTQVENKHLLEVSIEFIQLNYKSSTQ